MRSQLWIEGRLPDLNSIIDESQKFVYVPGKRGKRVRLSKYAETKKRYGHTIGLQARTQNFRAIGRGYFTYLFVEPNRRRDPSNFVGGGVKIIEDALQEARLLKGDGWKNVLGMAAYWIVSKKPPGVFVDVDPKMCLTKVAIMIQWQGHMADREAAA